MGRRAVWGWGVLFVVAAPSSACTFDFDAPFEEGGSGGSGASSTGVLGAGTSTSSTASTASTTASSSGGEGGSTGSSGGEQPFGVPCGGSMCLFEPGQGGCCWDQYEAQGDPRAECFTSPPSSSDCRTQANQMSRETLIRCRDASDCPGGEECCGAYQMNGGDLVYSTVACAEACGGSDTTLCDPDASDPCPLSEATCSAALGLPDDYFGCLF